MSRVARIVVPRFPHHSTQRGNRRCDVFETEGDREAYLRFLKQYTDKRGLSIWAYCLMTNHIHLLKTQGQTTGFSFSAAHCGMKADTVLSPDFPPTGVVDDWAEWLHSEPEEVDKAYERIRQQTHTGRPCGSGQFLDQLEHLLQRKLCPKKAEDRRKRKTRSLSLGFL